jgi:hypothetical protein
MLDDTAIPQSVVDAFGFTLRELNGEEQGDGDPNHHLRAAKGSSPLGLRSSSSPNNSLTVRSKRAAALHLIQRVGSVKTVMRYLVTMITERREGLLQQYVAKMRGLFAS